MSTHRNNLRSRFDRLLAVSCGAAVLVLAPSAVAQPRSTGPEILADSYIDFSGVQGQGGWFYGFYDGDSAAPWTESDFELLPIFDQFEGRGAWYRALGPGGYWTHLHVWGGHPNGVITSGGRIPEENWAVRRWVSPTQHIVRVQATLMDLGYEPRAANGVVGHIIAGGTIWRQAIENGPYGAVADVEFCVDEGTGADFAIDPRDSNDWGDETYFVITVRSIIALQPRDVSTGPGGTATFSVALDALNAYSFQWRHNGAPIQGATGPTLTLQKVQQADAGVYDCFIGGECGSMLTRGATLTLCAADFNHDGVVDSMDFFDFLDGWSFGSHPLADFNNDGAVNSQDLFEFLAAFFAGCPA